MTTHVLIPGTHNSRDLGGIAAEGGRLRSRMLVRSDALTDLGTAGHSALRALGLRSAIDLRNRIERELDPVDLDGTGIRLLERPVLGPRLELHGDVGLADIYHHLLGNRGEKLTEVVRLLATPGTLPAIFFCSAGKDRTGLIAMLTLAAAGAGDEGIVADYAATACNMRGEFLETLIRRAVAAGITEQQLAVNLGSPASLMRETLAWLRAHHGGPLALLRSHGMTDAEIDSLRLALVVRTAKRAA